MKLVSGKINFTTLYDASLPRYYYKKIAIDSIVSGKGLSLYYVPKKIQAKCKRDKKQKCQLCILNTTNELEISEDCPQILSFIDISEDKVFNVVRKIFDIPKICNIQYKIIEPFNLSEIFLIPAVSSYQNIDAKYVNRLAYYIGNDLECNIPYRMFGYSVPEPKRQKVVHVITKAKSIKDDICGFEITPQLNKDLKIFNPAQKSISGIFDKLKELYNIYSKNITKIYNRIDLHMGIDLVFHSPLSFNFGNQFIKKGWGDILILGDTNTGKGFTAQRLAQYYGLGEVISAENCTLAGLIGGVQQINNHWVLTWGKIPQNDKKLVIVDEASGLTEEDWGKMSRVRSEGIAEVTKIQSQVTNARTRIIFISNPKEKMRLMSTYGYGIDAMYELIKKPEDIARFDFVVITGIGEVPIEIPNSKQDEINNPYSRDLEKKLILWIWSRNDKQIYFTDDAINDILKISIKLGHTYHPSVPLIQGENVRIKLAKISCMIAGRVYSASEDGQNLIVDSEHVGAAYKFLDMLYKKDICGYYAYSQMKNRANSIKNIEKVKEFIDSFKNPDIIYEVLLNTNQITGSNLEYSINQPREVVKELISVLLANYCIEQKYQYFYKKEAFTNWLKQHARF